MKEGLEPFLKGDILKHEGGYSQITEIQNNPDYLAKEIVLYAPGEEREFEKKRQKFEQNLLQIKQYFADFIPEFHLAYGHSDVLDEKAPYVFMKKVMSIHELSEENIRKFLNEKDEFLSKSVQMYNDTYNNGTGDFLDLGNRNNFIYGATENSNNPPHLYFVDLYPMLRGHAGRFFYDINANRDRNLFFINDKEYKYKDFPKIEYGFPKTEEALKTFINKH